MISADSNLFVYAADPDCDHHDASRAFFESPRIMSSEFVVCELVLVEIYMLLRNPAVFHKPYTAKQAAVYCGKLRCNPAWDIVDYDPEISPKLWSWARQTRAGFRQIIDARIALTLRHHGVTDFATRNTKHFKGFGFQRVWNPLDS